MDASPIIIEEPQVQSLEIVRQLLPWRKQLSTTFGTSHGNASLQTIDLLIVMLAAFYNPIVRSQRLVEALSEQAWMKARTSVERVPRSTLSEAMKRFDPEALRPLLKDLARRVPGLGKRDADLEGVTRQVLANDGSMFNLAGEVAWAMANRKGRSAQSQSRVRLNLQLDVERGCPVECDISGGGEGSEAAAFQRRLQPHLIYVLDRNFVNFGFLQAVLDIDSNFVLRLRKDVNFAVDSSLELSAKDQETNVRSDELGHLTGPVSTGNEGRRCRTGQAPAQTLRRVVVWDEKNQQTLLLLTDLLDVPAHGIGLLYRLRWQIELFFRWLKCHACMEHLLSKSPRGITLQFYIAVIATLLLHIATGRRVNKYALFWLGAVAAGQATFEQMQAGLARIEREKMLERIRLAKKRLAAKKV
jgi:hypothetical protein